MLNLPFLSPTINLWMVQTDYLKFVLDLDYYLHEKLHFINEKETFYGCPVAGLGEGEREIILIFLHYKDRESARTKWEERKRRINMDKLCLIMSDRDGITYEHIQEFGKIPCYRKVMFTYKEYPEFDFTYKLEADGNKEYVRNYQMKNWYGFWRWELQFDCVKWLRGKEM